MISRAIRVGGVYPMMKFTSMEVSRVPRLVLATSAYFLCGCIMLIRMSQNKKKSGNRTSCVRQERKEGENSKEQVQKWNLPQVSVTQSLKRGWVSPPCSCKFPWTFAMHQQFQCQILPWHCSRILIACISNLRSHFQAQRDNSTCFKYQQTYTVWVESSKTQSMNC